MIAKKAAENGFPAVYFKMPLYPELRCCRSHIERTPLGVQSWGQNNTICCWSAASQLSHNRQNRNSTYNHWSPSGRISCSLCLRPHTTSRSDRDASQAHSEESLPGTSQGGLTFYSIKSVWCAPGNKPGMVYPDRVLKKELMSWFRR